MYATFVCDLRPLKNEIYRVRITVGGDKLSYDDDAGSPAANLLETKLLINSTISTPGAQFDCLDIKDMYYKTPMTEYEYMKIVYSEIPYNVIKHYNLHHLVHTNGYVYREI